MLKVSVYLPPKNFAIFDKYLKFLGKLIKGFAVSVVNFDFHYVIGTGGQGQVWMARKLDGVDKDRLYAIKVMVKVANNCWGRESNTFNERNVSIVFFFIL